MDSWRAINKMLMALPLSDRPGRLFSEIKAAKNVTSDDESALKLVNCSFWQENLLTVNNEDLFAALWIVSTKVKSKTAAVILRDFYLNAREKCRPIMLYWAWWANYTALSGNRSDALKICDRGLSQAVEVNRHVVEEVKEAIKNERLVDIPPPTLTRSSKNGNENCGSDTSVTRQQLSKLSLSDERKVLERVDLQNMESLASQKNAAGAAASSSTGDREVETRKIEDNLNSSMEKLRLESRKAKEDILQAIEEQNVQSKNAADQMVNLRCEILQPIEEQNIKLQKLDEEMTNFKGDIMRILQSMAESYSKLDADLNFIKDAIMQALVAPRDKNLQAADIPLKKKRAVSDAYPEGETVRMDRSNWVTFLSSTSGEQSSLKNDKQSCVDQNIATTNPSSAELRNIIPADDCDVSMTSTDNLVPAAPARVDPSTDAENFGIVSRKARANNGTGLKPMLPSKGCRNVAASKITSWRASEKQLSDKESDAFTPESSPAVAGFPKYRPTDRMPRDSACVRANQQRSSNNGSSRISDAFVLPGRGIAMSTPFGMYESPLPTLNMSIIPSGASCPPINEEDEAVDSRNVTPSKIHHRLDPKQLPALQIYDKDYEMKFRNCASSLSRDIQLLRKMAVGPSGAVVGEPMNNLVAGIGEVLGENKQMDKKSNSAKIPPRSMNLDYITNPFTDESIELFFKKSEMSPKDLRKFRKIDGGLPEWIPGKEVRCGAESSFVTCEFVDMGKFGRVFKLRDSDGVVYAAKVHNPPFPWEYYVLLLLRNRLENFNLAFDINVNIQQPRAFYCFDDAAILVSKYYSSPTMLNFHNHLAAQKISLDEAEIIILLLEFISILEIVHKCEILHGDLKPDNVIMRVPGRLPRNKKEFFTGELCFLVLIDFGRGVDMSMFPKNHKFLSTDGVSSFTCTQMLDGKPWSYELDFFCMAACIHMLIFGKYMKNITQDKETGRYRLMETPKRSFNRDLWSKFFNIALNDAYKTSLLPSLRDNFKDYLYTKFDDMQIFGSYQNLKKMISQV